MTSNKICAGKARNGTAVGAIELSGQMSRTEWEALYLVVKKLATEHGLNVDAFDLKVASNSTKALELRDSLGQQTGPQDAD